MWLAPTWGENVIQVADVVDKPRVTRLSEGCSRHGGRDGSGSQQALGGSLKKLSTRLHGVHSLPKRGRSSGNVDITSCHDKAETGTATPLRHIKNLLSHRVSWNLNM
ncbi:uncharacterized protein METZ01_LOCUS172890 [marine metagenome]|uniref:Uncharacterized protein n=1 Tax=marine metagenome TaxID=408172 RepID=A0A382C1U2_9ZZZZ